MVFITNKLKIDKEICMEGFKFEYDMYPTFQKVSITEKWADTRQICQQKKIRKNQTKAWHSDSIFQPETFLFHKS